MRYQWFAMAAWVAIHIFTAQCWANNAGTAAAVKTANAGTGWHLCRCGLPEWSLRSYSGPFGPSDARRQYVSVGTAYGHRLLVSRAEVGRSLSRLVVAASAIVLAARNHYAPRRSLCSPGLLRRLNVYCAWALWIAKPQARKLRPLAAVEVARLLRLKKRLSAAPLSAGALRRLRSRVAEAAATQRPYATIYDDLMMVEYPSVEAMNWRLGTFKAWPLPTALVWQDGLTRMQVVAAGRAMAIANPGLSHWNAAALRIGSLHISPMGGMGANTAKRARAIFDEACRITWRQIERDLGAGRIKLSHSHSWRGLAAALRQQLLSQRSSPGVP